MSGSADVYGILRDAAKGRIDHINMEVAVTAEITRRVKGNWREEWDASVVITATLSELVLITITNYCKTTSIQEEFALMRLAREIVSEELRFVKKFSELDGTFRWEATSDGYCLLEKRVEVRIPHSAPECTVSEVKREVTFYTSDCSGNNK